MARTGTRERIIDTTAELMSRQGYNATGVKQIVTAAQAPFGSVYHHFPGGKEQLGAEAVRVSGIRFGELVPAVFDPAPDPVTAVRWTFAGAAANLEQSGWADACPIATIALETASVSEPMRLACHEAFESWLQAGTDRFADAGIAPARARELMIGLLAALEGAFVLARAARSTEALLAAGEMVAATVEQALGDAGDV